jgi:hypothetical protein
MSEDRVIETAGKAVRTAITLARDLWEGVMIEALRRGLTLTQVAEAALRRWLGLGEAEREKEGGRSGS